MFEFLEKYYEKVELKTIDDIKNIEQTKIFQLIIEHFPNIKDICNQGKNKDELEYIRTFKHIFRTSKIYYLIIQNKFSHETLSQYAIEEISKKAINVNFLNRNLLPLILIYHDLGRLVRKSDHPYQSYKLITEKGLLKPYALNCEDDLIVKKVIEYHLLFATIYTGESTFYAVYSILNDIELVELLSKNEYYKMFVDLLEVFTFIDILGYPYSQIYDHYVKYYHEINLKLKKILEPRESKEVAIKIAFEYSLEWINWRLAGALRIFQFLETESELTINFFFQKLEDSIKNSENSLLINMNLKQINDIYLKPSCKIQLKYALGFLMILAFGKFTRSKITNKTIISDKLIIFWILLSKEIQKRVPETNAYLWNVYILGIKNWFGLNQSQFNHITSSFIKKIINNAYFEIQQETKEYALYLDFKELDDLS